MPRVIPFWMPISSRCRLMKYAATKKAIVETTRLSMGSDPDLPHLPGWGLRPIFRFRLGRQDLGDAGGELLRVADVEEFVRPVGVGVRAEHAGDEELGAREFRAEHRHERDRAALAHPHHALA